MRRPFCQRRTDQTGLPPGDSLSRSRLFARSGAVIRVVITCASHQHAWNPSSSLSTSTMSPSFHSSSGGSVVGGRWRDGAGERAVSGIRPGPGPLPTTTIPCALDATLLSSFVPLRSSSPRARSLEAQDHHPCANLLPARKLSDKNPGAWAVKRRARPHLCAARRAVPSRVGGGARRARAQRWHPGATAVRDSPRRTVGAVQQLRPGILDFPLKFPGEFQFGFHRTHDPFSIPALRARRHAPSTRRRHTDVNTQSVTQSLARPRRKHATAHTG